MWPKNLNSGMAPKAKSFAALVTKKGGGGTHVYCEGGGDFGPCLIHLFGRTQEWCSGAKQGILECCFFTSELRIAEVWSFLSVFPTASPTSRQLWCISSTWNKTINAQYCCKASFYMVHFVTCHSGATKVDAFPLLHLPIHSEPFTSATVHKRTKAM